MTRKGKPIMIRYREIDWQDDKQVLTRVGDGEVDGDVSLVLVNLVITAEVATDPAAVPLGAWSMEVFRGRRPLLME